VIKIEDLWKKYSNTWALRGISLQVDEGKVLGVLGENGSGKSSLFKILAGVVRCSDGQVRIMDQPVGLETRRITSLLPENDCFYGWMKVAEQLEFLAHFYPQWDRHKEKELLEFMNIPVDRKVGALSKGQKARLKVVVAFSWPSRLVLMDEPFGGIDPPSRRKIMAALFDQFRFGEQTILISTHLVEEIEEFVEDVVFLRDGEIALQGNVNRFREEQGKSLADLFEEVVT
jgi:ABC-2 type transport system ATP-binding protein